MEVSAKMQSSFMSLRSSILLYSRNRPNECQCHRIDVKNCKEDDRKKQEEYFERDMDDIADSVMQVMRICGLNSWDVKHTREVIKRSFRHYDEIRYRIDRVPRKRFARENFIYDLAKKAGMSRIDCQVAYSIVKRAFRAYYHGTAFEGKRVRSIVENMRHTQECLWVHAAKRTAEVHAAYKGLMYSEQQLFEERIECVYKSLHEALMSREFWDDEMQCTCTKKNAIGGIRSQDTGFNTLNTTEVEILFRNQSIVSSEAGSQLSIRMENITNRVENMLGNENESRSQINAANQNAQGDHLKQSPSGALRASCTSLRQTLKAKTTFSVNTVTSELNVTKCMCPRLQCDREFERETPVITAECSQGPYICRWLPYNSEEEEFKEHRVPFPPLETICPACPTDTLPCDSECTCTCNVCECKPAYDIGGEEEHHGEKLSSTGLEDYDTDYCWLAPFRDWPRVDKPHMVEEAEEEESCISASLEEGHKHRAVTFTYLAPFRPQKPEDKVEPQVEILPEDPVEAEDEDLMNKRPPQGISVETYCCWNQPPPSSSSSSEDNQIILVLPNNQQPKISGISMDVTVKKQHQQAEGQQALTKQQPTTNTTPKSIVKTNRPSKAQPHPATPRRQSLITPPRPNTPATPPPAAPPTNPPNPPAPVQRRESKLTKDDILDIIGL
ncbi:uncharacterized protein Dwil_GK15685 [Drosophila willistoni]|uniref:Uncharacterized protein n=1 Tax=Drosophila willistoni TaxID=7260 RepID=B4MRV1_DROWI|nr:uncharacterized protein LOC6640883 [Drosophila willistoni]EDW74840.1 uncharacterized protein Dwil_GK15685 [Drosophila willistoni]